MRAVTLFQPWATLLAGGEKRNETRSWQTSYRGRVAIHASKKMAQEDYDRCWTHFFARSLTRLGIDDPRELPFGAIVGIGTLRDVVACMDLVKTLSEQELEFGNYSMGRWAWQFVDLCKFQEPIPCRGMQGLWTVPDHLLGNIERERSRT